MLHIDIDQSVKFLRLIDATARAFTFQTFREKGDTASNVEPKVIHSNSLTELRREHVGGAGVYVTVNETDGTGRKNENVKRVRCVFQEDDGGCGGPFPLAPSLVIESSPGHFHRYWLVADDWPADEKGRADFAAVMERMIETYGSDKNAKDISRVLRLPGFWHRKADKGPVKPFQVRIIEAGNKRYTREQILAAFPPVVRQQSKPRTEWQPRDSDDERIRDAINYIDPDDRDVWLQIAMALKDEMGDSGRSLWDSWSSRSKKFEERDQDKTWRSLRRHGITIATLFHHAKQAGWIENKSHVNGSKHDHTKNEGGAACGWKLRTFTGQQLQTMTFPPISWIVPDIIPGEGLTLLCSKPKFGKSWLAYDLCIASTMGRATLGEIRPAQGDVLYLALEDSKRRLQRRMTKLLPTFNAKWPERLTITTEWRRLHEGGLDDIREWHAQTKGSGGTPIMVVIDVVAKVRKPAGNKHLYDADYEAIGVMAELAHELGIAIVAIHHTRKMAADDLMEMVSGSFGTTGAADTVLILASKGGGAVLDIRGRDVESAEKAVEFSKDACRWRIIGDAAEVHVSEQRAKIIAALKEAGEPMTIAALMEATWMKRNPLDALLGKMVRDQTIKRIRAGVYAHKDYVGPPPPDKPIRAKSDRSDRSDRKNTDGANGRGIENASTEPASSVKNRSDRSDDQIRANIADLSIDCGLGSQNGQKSDRSDQSDDLTVPDYLRATIAAGGRLPGQMAANGFAISATPEDRKPPEPGQLTARVWIREICPPAISARPDDDLNDFTISGRPWR